MEQYENFLTAAGERLQVLSDGLRVVTLGELKSQMRVEDSVEDELIVVYGQAAERAVIDSTRRPLEALCVIGYEQVNGPLPDGASAPGVEWFPPQLRIAVLMLASHLYRNREPVSTGAAPAAIPYTLEALVKPFVRLGR